MALVASRPLDPLPWRQLLAATGVLWLAPMALGLCGLAIFMAFSRGLGDQMYGELALSLWAISYALLLSPAFSWVGWVIALPAVAFALGRGWFGWGPAALIGITAGTVAGAVVESDLALPFAILALLALRAVLGRVLPL